MNSYRKIILTLLIALAGMGAAQAQFRFGVKAGINVNNLKFNRDIFNDDNQCGYTLGVMGEFNVPVIGLGVDLSAMYTRMNASPEYYDNGVETEGSFGKDFLEIPINVKYKFSLPVVGSVIAPYIYTGPTFAFNLNKKTFENIKSKTCQTAWNVGLGVELVKHLQVQASYGFGMNNVAKYIGTEPVDLKVKNNYWTVTAAYLF